ncbi:MAG: S-methyl-5-thioribose-1-phosphate isomerase, partial [Myxococcota bacterium]|nr:S-methyl-5-thioribose-1-phosphate isomerase [Myxococcota bacterium]
MKVDGRQFRTVWLEDDQVTMIDQRLLPHSFEVIHLPTVADTAHAIFDMAIRGAGAIGATGAYGMAQAAIQAPADVEGFEQAMAQAAATLGGTRPTAQNLFYGINAVIQAAQAEAPDVEKARQAAVAAAHAVADDDSDKCRRIGEHGAELIGDRWGISTHCNAGWLAFVDWGSALSPIYAAHRQGKRPLVYVDETRPRCQGARLTCWELAGEGVDHALVVDGAVGHYMQWDKVQMVIVGSDRIAYNGDVANKIGTFASACMAHQAGVPFYVAAPTTTIDPNCPAGREIPIEER